MLPEAGELVSSPVRIHWSDNLVPFIEAESDQDLAAALGFVHAHLRLGQMEMMRRLALGRVSEMIGPIAIDLDHLIRILDLGRSVPDILAGLPPDTRQWLERFVDGINHHLMNAEQLPKESSMLGLKKEPWTVPDVLQIGRFTAADVNWLIWFNLLRLRDDPDWPRLWRRLEEDHDVSPEAAINRSGTQPFSGAFGLNARWASNSLVVAASRSATGGALIFNDPHLGIHLPVPWLVVAFQSPGHHAVGLMPVGLPFIAMGRNPWIAWGGANVHAASSDFYDVGNLPEDTFSQRRETIKVRWWRDQGVTIRNSHLGPIISDARLLGLDRTRPIALRWMGHQKSDEISAMLSVSRARNRDEFNAAIEGISVSGQTMTYADVNGNTGRVLAVHLPNRSPGFPRNVLSNPADTKHWQHRVKGSDLSSQLGGEDSILISANQRPGKTRVPVGYFFSPADRAERLHELIGSQVLVSTSDLKLCFSDVYQVASHTLCREIARHMPAHAPDQTESTSGGLEANLINWDGRYQADSSGALAFELVFHYLLMEVYGRATIQVYLTLWNARALVYNDIARGEVPHIDRALQRALRRARRPFKRYRTWGGMHRLRLSHPFSHIPLVGRRYVLYDDPAAGSRDTVYATGHTTGTRRHAALYGVGARHISDLSDPNQNEFILLGGQDGWLGSTAYGDQVPLWQTGTFLQVPLDINAAKDRFLLRTDLLPSSRRRTEQCPDLDR